jgi:hypothetical protein
VLLESPRLARPLSLDLLELFEEDREVINRPLLDVEGYFRGLLWVFEMYLSGECPDYEWMYGCLYAPDSRAIAAFDSKTGRLHRLLRAVHNGSG